MVPKPAAAMPVATEIRLEFGDDHNVVRPGLDGRRAPRADVSLAGGMGLNGKHAFVHPKNPHARASATRTSAPTTMAMSALDACVFRNGLKPMTNGSVGRR